MKKIAITILALLTALCAMLAIACDRPSHNFSSTYSYDEDTHWQQCLDEGCAEKANESEHNYQLTGTLNTCSVCGYSYNTANTYEVNLQTMGGTVLAGVTVSLIDGANATVATAKTNIRGKVRFSDLSIGDYTAKIDKDTLPKGFDTVSEELLSVSLSSSNMKTTVKLPSTLIDEDMPNEHKYSVGDVAYNFSTTSVDKDGEIKNISLKSYLGSRKAVILNFWYASCNPCLAEFPYMNDAYLDYRDEIAIIAINSGAETPEEVASFVAQTKYLFDFVNDEDIFNAYNKAFNVQAYPTTVVIDRYGAIAHIESGSIPSRSAWINLFEHYSSADYVPDYSYGYNGGDDSDDNETLAKPDVEMPTSEEIAEKITLVNDLTTKATFNYLPDDNEYSWPWVFGTKDGVDCLKTSNKDRVGSFSILYIEVELKAGQKVFFDYFVSTEEETDILYIQVNTVLQQMLSGENSEWHNDELLYVARRDGKYQISLTYQKSVMTNAGDDTVYIKNLRIEDAEVNGHYDLLYNATDNYTLDQNADIPDEYKGYLNHVAYYFNESDGFYHVALSGNPEQKDLNSDPVLLADLYYSTPWNYNSVWMLAYARTGLFNEADKDYKSGYYEAVEDYAWIQQNNDTRYVPLNKELHQILVDVVADLGRDDHSQDPHHGNDQWLELCRYYVHYGEKDGVCYSLDNTVEALKWRVAKDYGVMSDDKLIDFVDSKGNVFEDVFAVHVDVYSVHLPRGNYYKFQTTKAGAYLIRSHEPIASDYDTSAQDTMGFICDEKGNVLAENDNFIIEVQGYDDKYPLYDNNFYIYIYLEANTTYYVAGCFSDPYATGEYDITIKFLSESTVEDSFSYFTSCAADPTYTFDEDDPNFTLFILPLMGKDRFYIGDDGNYYAQEFDGSQGSLIYIRMVGPTYLNSYIDYTLEQMITNDTINVDISDKLYLTHLLNQAKDKDQNDELYGYVVATEKLVSIINQIANGSDTEDSNTYSSTSWLLTAYYYRNVNELTLQQAQAKYK